MKQMHRSHGVSTPLLHPCLKLQTQERPHCPVCNKDVPLESAKTDEDGHAIHEECYILRLHLREGTHGAH